MATSSSSTGNTTAHSHNQSHPHNSHNPHPVHSPSPAQTRAASRKSGDPFIVERPDSVRAKSGSFTRPARSDPSSTDSQSSSVQDHPSGPTHLSNRTCSQDSSIPSLNSAPTSSRSSKLTSGGIGPVVNSTKWRVMTCSPGHKIPGIATTILNTAIATSETSETTEHSSAISHAHTHAHTPSIPIPTSLSGMTAPTKTKSRSTRAAATAAASSITNHSSSTAPRSVNVTRVATPTPTATPIQTPTATPTRSSVKSSTVATLPPPPNNGMAPFPLSTRKAHPLDLNSVERRCPPEQPSADGRATPEAHKIDRHFGLKECPTYRPTTEEFRDPLKFIRSIAAEGRKYGIVKIIPPDTWHPPFAIDTERFHFRTRRQELNEVEGSNRESVTYLEALAKFHKQNSNAHLYRFPCVDKRPLDLYRLKRLVEEKGGFDSVCKTKRWAEIGRDLGYSGKIMSSLSTSLKNSYQKWIQSFEIYISKNRAAVFPDGTPSPSKHSPGKTGSQLFDINTKLSAPSSEQQPDAPKPDSPASSQSTPAPDPARSIGSSGFTAVNRGCSDRPPLSRTSSSSMRVKTEGISNGVKKRDLETLDTPTSSRRSKRIKRESGPVIMGLPLAQPKTVINSVSVNDQDEDTENGTPPTEGCEVCGKIDESLRECDGCDCLYHFDCLEEKQRPSEKAEWHCPKCLVGTGDYGFQDGSTYSLRQFQEKAQFFKQNHFGKERESENESEIEQDRPRDENGNVLVAEDEVEREFWRLAESLTEPVEVEYGADIHSGIHGSGFPTVEKFPEEPYALDAWNLNVLPLEKGSLFRHIKSDINGMTVPWVYVGMCFSCFCWHAEDHNTYSINYQHFGDTKTWYAIPAHSFDAFERATHELAPELMEKQPDLLYQLVTLFTPDKLRRLGVEVYAADQRAGQFIVTFPQAYHAGFNHGFNLNEAVNFAPDDWEEFGEGGVLRLREFRRAPCFSHDELLLTIASRDQSIRTGRWLAPALEKMRNREMSERLQFYHRHGDAVKRASTVDLSQTSAHEFTDLHLDSLIKGGSDRVFPHSCRLETDNCDSGETESSICGIICTREDSSLGEEDYVCGHCSSFSYLSRLYCPASKKSYCLLHAGEVECCPALTVLDDNKACFGPKKSHILYLRYTDTDLNDVVDHAIQTAALPDRWIKKVERLSLENEAPQLKALKAILAEGERMNSQWDVSDHLVPLRRFVARCVEWVDSATGFVSRKQARRKTRRDDRPSQGDKDKDKDRDRDGSEDIKSIGELRRLLVEAESLGFDSPEVSLLKERADQITEYQASVLTAVAGATSSRDIQPLVSLGRALGVAGVPEVEMLEGLGRQLSWWEEVRSASERIDALPRHRCVRLLEDATAAGISPDDDSLCVIRQLLTKADSWEARAQTVLAVEQVHDQQLETLSRQAMGLPVIPITLSAVQARLNRQKAARDAIVTLLDASHHPDFRKRPRYRDVRIAVEEVSELSASSKPAGTADLERELKRHEDWMRRGKKLFGKANAPLHILMQHMQYVEERNRACLDVDVDIFEEFPEGSEGQHSSPKKPEQDKHGERDSDPDKTTVFCICRKAEWGMMVECELCHEWYHGRCLKISRTKLKEDEKFTCPICDYRVTIPRDAARPKLEDCTAWQDEIATLPFQPDEEETLRSIVDFAVGFRDFLSSSTFPGATPSLKAIRFFLRKLEGADILLVQETNFLRSRLHRLAPVAIEPPQPIAESLSTRKPRPTKQQKMMVQYGVSTPEELPAHVKIRKRRENTTVALTLSPSIPVPSLASVNAQPPSGNGGDGGGGDDAESKKRKPLQFVTSTQTRPPRQDSHGLFISEQQPHQSHSHSQQQQQPGHPDAITRQPLGPLANEDEELMSARLNISQSSAQPHSHSLHSRHPNLGQRGNGGGGSHQSNRSGDMDVDMDSDPLGITKRWRSEDRDIGDGAGGQHASHGPPPHSHSLTHSHQSRSDFPPQVHSHPDFYPHTHRRQLSHEGPPHSTSGIRSLLPSAKFDPIRPAPQSPPRNAHSFSQSPPVSHPTQYQQQQQQQQHPFHYNNYQTKQPQIQHQHQQQHPHSHQPPNRGVHSVSSLLASPTTLHDSTAVQSRVYPIPSSKSHLERTGPTAGDGTGGGQENRAVLTTPTTIPTVPDVLDKQQRFNSVPPPSHSEISPSSSSLSPSKNMESEAPTTQTLAESGNSDRDQGRGREGPAPGPERSVVGVGIPG